MRTKEFQKLLKKNQSKSNSGFTLTELLVGLFMSIFVIGALGFGLTTVLQTTQRENSKTAARNENSRALDFISDELRRAESVKTTGSGFSAPSGVTATPVLALDLPDSALSGSTNDIVYYLRSNTGTNWKGPLVLSRWGPVLNSNGKYQTTWGHQVLLDGIDNTTVTSACPTGTTTTPTTPKGFYACITGTNTAQLFLTGQTKTASGVNDTQTNDSQVVARAKETLANRTDLNTSVSWNVEPIGSPYACNSTSTWDMRTDFGNDPTNADNTTKLITRQDVNKQPQPIAINPDADLVVTSSAVNATGCLNNDRGNPGTDNQNNPLSSYNNKVSHTIDFGDPLTFNGNGNLEGGTYNEPKVIDPDETVQFFKQGSIIPSTYGGYDANKNGNLDDPGDQPSLGKFLYESGLAIPKISGADPYNKNTEFKMPTPAELQSFLASSELETLLTNKGLTTSEKQEYKDRFKVLGDDQRIIAMELGHDYPDKNNDGSAIEGGKNPGFDLQDNIFIVTSNVFKKKFPACAFSGGCSAGDDSGTETGSET